MFFLFHITLLLLLIDFFHHHLFDPFTQEQFALGDPTRGQQKPPNNIASGITVETVIPIN